MARPLDTIIDTGDPPIIFVSYSRKDKDLKDAILPQLKSLERLGIFSVWDDDQIKAGVEWYARIYEVLSKTKVAVCLISPDFLSSAFCMDEEIPYLLQARNRGDLEIFPILVEDCVWEEHRWLKRLQIPSADAVPLAKLDKADRNTVLAEMTRQIRDFLGGGKGWERPPPTGEPPEKVDIKRLPQTGELLFGRRAELKFLDDTWNDNKLNVTVFKASGGVGKSSLIRAWVEDMALDNYRGARRVFAWSFYSQGTKERVTSADEFISHALGWFGDETKGEGLSPWDRGQRLADLVREEGTLLLLDGLEPLQSGQAFDRGKIKDPGLEVLLDELGRNNPGLCLISTREEVNDLWHEEDQCQVGQFDLDTISKTAGRALLRVSGIEGEDAALEQAVRDFGQHAYAVKLLGNFLTWSGTPDIKHAAYIPDLPEIKEKDGKHPRRVMAAFVERFGDNAKADILAMLGLFDRPADAGCIAALREEPAVSGLNAAVLKISDATWREQIAELRALGLLMPESHHHTDELDAHPLVREHFGARLRKEREDAWRAGHERLYEHLKTVPETHQPDTLAEMAPLFQAVHHGCHAEKHQEVLDNVYFCRIARQRKAYLVNYLGAIGADLSLLASFFESAFERPTAEVTKLDQAYLLYTAAHCLRVLGRLGEAVTPMEVSQVIWAKKKIYGEAANAATNLAGLHVTLGNLLIATKTIKAATNYAKKSKGDVRKMTCLAMYADAVHQSGKLEWARKLFQKSEKTLKKIIPEMKYLFSFEGYQYCDLLFSIGYVKDARDRTLISMKTLEHTKSTSLIDAGLHHLSLGRAACALKDTAQARSQLDRAVGALRESGQRDEIPKALLARAAFFRQVEEYEKSWHDLDEAMRLATRCGMRLFECDAHLEYARLEIKQGQPDAARVHVKSADVLITACGYHRRDGELLELKEELGL